MKILVRIPALSEAKLSTIGYKYFIGGQEEDFVSFKLFTTASDKLRCLVLPHETHEGSANVLGINVCVASHSLTSMLIIINFE